MRKTTKNKRDKKSIRKRTYTAEYRKNNHKSICKKSREYYKANPWIFAPGRHAVEMREIINELLGVKLKRGMKLEDLYDIMVAAIRKNPLSAVRKFPYGKPDAASSKVEWKFGFDRLRACQFVWNTLNGFDCKVRWAPSCDDFEKAISGKDNKNRLFKSYRDFVIWGYGINNERTGKAATSEVG